MSPSEPTTDTLVVTKRLHNEGMKAALHSAARSLKDADWLDGLLAAYRAEAGVDEVSDHWRRCRQAGWRIR